jgi:hypothetical protein
LAKSRQARFFIHGIEDFHNPLSSTPRFKKEKNRQKVLKKKKVLIFFI